VDGNFVLKGRVEIDRRSTAAFAKVWIIGVELMDLTTGLGKTLLLTLLLQVRRGRR
jgi:hypothetical protein